MARFVAAALLTTQLLGCFTYALNVEEPRKETMGLFVGVELAIGLGMGASIHASDRGTESLLENLGIGTAGVIVLDLLLGLGAWSLFDDADHQARPPGS